MVENWKRFWEIEVPYLFRLVPVDRLAWKSALGCVEWESENHITDGHLYDYFFFPRIQIEKLSGS